MIIGKGYAYYKEALGWTEHTNIKMQLLSTAKFLNDEYRGKSRHEAKKEMEAEREKARNFAQAYKGKASLLVKPNSTRTRGMAGTGTTETYIPLLRRIADSLKENQPEIYRSRDISQLSVEVIARELYRLENEPRADGSIPNRANTSSTRMAALNKVLGELIPGWHITREKCKSYGYPLQERSYKSIDRSRTFQKEENKNWNYENNRDAIFLNEATGCRRSSLIESRYAMKPSSFFYKNGTLFVGLIEKGNKYREVKILDNKVNEVEEMVMRRGKENDPDFQIEDFGNVGTYKPSYTVVNKEGQKEKAIVNIDYPKNAMTDEEFRKRINQDTSDTIIKHFSQKAPSHENRASYLMQRHEELFKELKSSGKSSDDLPELDYIKDGKGIFNQDCISICSLEAGHGPARTEFIVNSYSYPMNFDTREVSSNLIKDSFKSENNKMFI